MKYISLILATVLIVALVVGCGSKGSKLYDTNTTDSGLEIRDLVVGTGPAPDGDDKVFVQYSGWLTNGQFIEASSGGEPFEFEMDSGQVIDGWEEGIKGMSVGGKRRLVIPPQLGYGSAGNSALGIPANATLIYEIELVDMEQVNWVTTASGLKYTDVTVEFAPTPQPGQECFVHYIGYLQDGTQFEENSPSDNPATFILSRAPLRGWDEGVATMTVGSKRRLKIPPDLGYGSAGNSQLGVPGDATLIYEMLLQDVGSTYNPPTASGLLYADTTAGTGATPQAGQRCYVHYIGWLTNGTEFDENQAPTEPWSFVVGRNHVIKGWDEAVATMTVGTVRRMYVPPDLAYGEAGQGDIPPNATLVFEVELTSLGDVEE